jgi:hypothetical protein
LLGYRESYEAEVGNGGSEIVELYVKGLFLDGGLAHFETEEVAKPESRVMKMVGSD